MVLVRERRKLPVAVRILADCVSVTRTPAGLLGLLCVLREAVKRAILLGRYLLIGRCADRKPTRDFRTVRGHLPGRLHRVLQHRLPRGDRRRGLRRAARLGTGEEKGAHRAA